MESPQTTTTTCPQLNSFINYLQIESSKQQSSIISMNSNSLLFWDFIHYFIFRPLFAAFFVLFILAFVWWVAWKTVLVHVPLVQEIFGLRKKPPKPPPPQRRFTQYYNSLNAAAKPVPPHS